MLAQAEPFSVFSQEILDIYRSTRAKRTVAKMRQTLELFGRTVRPTTTADLTPAALARFAQAAAEGRAPNTAATLLAYLRAACAYAARRRMIESSPFALWPGWVKYQEGRPAITHAPEAIAKVLAYLAARSTESPEAGRLHCWAAVLAHTGLRRDEALFLRIEDLEMFRGLILVRRKLKRPTARRKVPIPPALGPILAAWIPRREGPHLFPNRAGKPWSDGARGYRPGDRLKAAGEACGVAGLVPSSLRHSFATHCATRWNLPPAVLQKLMGHTDLRTTMRYYVHLTDAHLTEAGRAIAFALPQATSSADAA